MPPPTARAGLDPGPATIIAVVLGHTEAHREDVRAATEENMSVVLPSGALPDPYCHPRPPSDRLPQVCGNLCALPAGIIVLTAQAGRELRVHELAVASPLGQICPNVLLSRKGCLGTMVLIAQVGTTWSQSRRVYPGLRFRSRRRPCEPLYPWGEGGR